MYIAGNGVRIIDVKSKTINDNFRKELITRQINNAELKAIYADKDSTLWIASFKGVVSINLKTKETHLYNKDENGSIISGLVNIVPFNNESFWIGSFGSGVFLFDKNKKAIVKTVRKGELLKDGLAENIVDAIYTDRDGNNWFSTEPAGVSMFNQLLLQFKTIRFNSKITTGAKNNSAQGIVRIGDVVLVSFYQSGILKYNLKDGSQKTISLPRQDEEITVQTFFKDGYNNVWAGTDYGLFYSTNTGESFKPYRSIRAYDFYDMFSFCSISKDTFLIGNSDGLLSFTYHADKKIPTPALLVKDTIVAIAKAGENKYIYASASNKLVIFSVNHHKTDVKKTFTINVRVKHIEAQDENIIWLSTATGIIILNIENGSTKNITEDDGLSDNFIYASLKGNDGCMWASTNNGINRISIADYSVTQFNTSGGLQGSEFNTGSWHKTNDLLFFGGTNGANYFNPSTINISDYKAPLKLIQVLANGIQVVTDSLLLPEPYKLTYRSNNIFLSFTAIDFNRSENIIYSYNINGKDWIDIGKDRTLRLLNLAPGKYTINVKSALQSGIESPEVLTVTFLILPPWYRTNTFFVLFALLAATIIYFAIRWFLKYKLLQQKRIIEKKELILKERERIIADLHDDVGSGLSAIRMMSDLMSAQAGQKSSANGFAQKISVTAKEIAQRMNAIIWSLNADNDTLGNFTEYVRQYGFTFFEDSNISFDFNSKNLPNIELNGIQRKNLFLITKEAFTNAARHSGATKVCFNIEVSDRLLQIEITDNGFGLKDNNPFGNGIRNMKRRMAEISGELQLIADNGTKINIMLPLSA